MKICIESLSAWYPGREDDLCLAQSICEKESDILWPKLDFVPAMQRRRLSPFAKIALFSAENALLAVEQGPQNSPNKEQCTLNLPMVFSSRHGDLHKTSTLLADLAQKEPLSPTAFGLSVHNAAPSLYSIFKQNRSEINVISAGKDSFFMALIDVYARLKSGINDSVLFIHADQALPETYQSFQDEQQLDHSLAMVISLDQHGPMITLAYQPITTDLADTKNAYLPAALSFLQWYESSHSSFEFVSDRYVWTCQKSV